MQTCMRACGLNCFSGVWPSATLWTVAHQSSLSVGFSRWEYWSGLPYPPPGDLPDPEIEPESLPSPALAGRFFTIRATWEAPLRSTVHPKPSASDTGTVWLREGSKPQTSKAHGLFTSYKCAKYLNESYKLTDSWLFLTYKSCNLIWVSLIIFRKCQIDESRLSTLVLQSGALT